MLNSDVATQANREVASKSQVLARIRAIGASWDERHETVDAPLGFQIGGDGHALRLGEGPRPQAWGFMLQLLAPGLTPCHLDDCADCADRADDYA